MAQFNINFQCLDLMLFSGVQDILLKYVREVTTEFMSVLFTCLSD